MKLNFNNKSVQKFFAVTVFVLMLLLAGCGHREEEFLQENTAEESFREELTPQETPLQEEAVTETAATAVPSGIPQKIYVDVCGAVAEPGVYELESDSRVFQAIEAAGGCLPDAAPGYLNRALNLTDGQKIYVPTEEEVESGAAETVENPEKSRENFLPGETENTSETDSSKINLNTADAAQLTTLNGIGESRAQAIIAYREENGPFTAVEDICNVSGIGAATFEKIKDKIAIE